MHAQYEGCDLTSLSAFDGCVAPRVSIPSFSSRFTEQVKRRHAYVVVGGAIRQGGRQVDGRSHRGLHI